MHHASRAARGAAVAACCLAAGAVPAQDFRIGGTGGALATMQQLADAYVQQHPGVRITVLPSLGSGGGIKALRLDGVEPSAQSIADGRYAYYKSMFIVTTTTTPPVAWQFVEFVQSAPAREILQRTAT
jgi:ABC-type phosphate transport system substrate-binding protein